jgi:hypothetical protein
VDVTTIAFRAQPDTTISSLRAIVRTVIRPETKVAASLRMASVQIPPLESHPVDRLLPQSRLQGMKKLLER